MFLDRLARASRALADANVDAMLLTPGADLFYLTGFEHGHAMERLLALVLHRDGSAEWVAPTMNVPQVEAHAAAGQTIRGWTDSEGYSGALRSALGGATRIAFDDEARAAFLMDALATVPGAAIRPASEILRRLRIRKDANEIAALRAEGAVVDQTIAEAISFCRPGRTEAGVDLDLRAALLRGHPAGGSVAFTIVAGGPNSALPHHETDRRPLERGDVVIVDFGTQGTISLDPAAGAAARRSRMFGYRSDITVTCAVGEPSDAEARIVYQIVYEAQQAAIAAVRPGVPCQQIDRAARAVIERAGYGPDFIHRTGHGLGLQGHEPPYLREGNAEPLEEGMVFSIEPGIYLPGRFGVRLEVTATVTADGAELLNAPSAPELPVAG